MTTMTLSLSLKEFAKNLIKICILFLRVGSDGVCTQGVTIGRSQAVQGRLAKAVLCIKQAQPLESSVAKKQSLDQHEGAF